MKSRVRNARIASGVVAVGALTVGLWMGSLSRFDGKGLWSLLFFLLPALFFGSYAVFGVESRPGYRSRKKRVGNGQKGANL